ncbi:MAG: hypothetical protein AAGG01_11945, partial [Planctomycetota bacterium]
MRAESKTAEPKTIEDDSVPASRPALIGRVMDVDGNPVAEGQVVLHWTDVGRLKDPLGDRHTFEARQDGSFAVEPHRSGAAEFWIESNGFG